MKKILIFDDDVMDCEILAQQVTEYFPSLQISVATNKEQFLSRIEDPSIGLILSDYKMPGFTGMDALEYCRTTFDHIPFVFVTGTIGSEEMAAETVLAGASGFILKDNLQKLKKLIPQLFPIAENIGQPEAPEVSKRTIYLIKLALETFKKIEASVPSKEFPTKEQRNRLMLVKDTLSSAMKNIDGLIVTTSPKKSKN